ncbi:MAG: SAM-dependent DNA methyltransferase [Bacteroidales bacterium]|nr:SAM-dependent DNA methyltransferase [Bacteroidales bacterium]
MTPEEKYISSVPLDHRKKHAQFFTPPDIAHFMCKWILEQNEISSILEPAYGLGIFSRTIRTSCDVKIDAYETDDIILSHATNYIPKQVNINYADYLDSDWEQKYDAIICNPPYLKFHDYNNSKYILSVNNHLNTKLNGFTNIYTLFLLKSISQLNNGGRLAYIVPSEFLNSDYGVEVKKALLESGTLRHIIIIDFSQCAFNEALTTACILLCSKDDQSKKISFSVVNEISNLENSINNGININIDQLNPEEKWKKYYSETNIIKYNNLVPFSTFAKVSRGIATGANNYFTFNKSKIERYNIKDHCFLPCICHSADVSNQIFSNDEFTELANNDKSVFLFNGCLDNYDDHVKNYLKLGEDSGINKKYLTASRKPWYAIENRKPSPIWVSVFNRKKLKFIMNEAGVYNLTTFHCVYNISNLDTNILFSYLITDVAKEIFMDNSRQYANGLIKFEPNDLNKGYVVDLRLLTHQEKTFIQQIYDKLKCHYNELYVQLLDIFFRDKYTMNLHNIKYYTNILSKIKIELKKVKSYPTINHSKQLSLFELIEHYGIQ